jgi:hypothetical protein
MPGALAPLLSLVPQAESVDPRRVDEAVRREVDYLRAARTPGVGLAGVNDSYELVLLTFAHAGVPETDLRFRELFQKMMEEPLTHTYKVVLQAMILEEVRRVKYPAKIAQGAQFLVDNQCQNGQWSYGEPSEFVKEVPPPRDVATSSGDRSGVREFDRSGDSKPRVTRRIAVRKMKEGPARGWCYARKDVCAKAHRPSFGRTAGGVASLAIYDYLLDLDARRDSVRRAGIHWGAANWSVTENRGTPEFDPQPASELYDALYALERLGMLCGLDLEKIGPHDGHAEGARAILDARRKDGSWSSGVTRCHPTWDTCFAILFLKKATRALVASEDGRARRRGEEK